MGVPSISVGIDVGGHEVSASLSLGRVIDWFGGLGERNAESRARDEDPSLRHYRSVRISCPSCRASVYSLTRVVRGIEMLRACRSCRSEFPVGF